MEKNRIERLLEKALQRPNRDKSRDAEYSPLPGSENRVPKGYYLVGDRVIWDDEIMPRNHPVRKSMGEGPFFVREYTVREGVFQDSFTDVPDDIDPEQGFQIRFFDDTLSEESSPLFVKLEKPVPMQADLLVTNERDALRAPAYCFRLFREPRQWIGPLEEGQELFSETVLNELRDRGKIKIG